ncbi:MAG: hypothetical protein VX834_13420 [Myxococcota bacterium]|nr:hypothetical protein [Myxococcota bacterium]
MTGSNYGAFQDKLIADDLIFAEEGLSPISKAMNRWRFLHIFAMARLAADGTDKVTVDENFHLGEMMAYLDAEFALSKSSLFSLEDVFEALASDDPGHASPPRADTEDFSAEQYRKELAGLVAQNVSARPWRAEQPPHAVTKTAFPGSAPDIPLPPSLRK